MKNLFETKVAGIPCTIDVHLATRVNGSHSYSAASDFDFHGYTEFQYTVCDQRGRPAPWLEKKMTKADEERIESEYFSD
jgi:hypothetical protein